MSQCWRGPSVRCWGPDDTSRCAVQGPSLPRRNHRSLRLALLSILAQLPGRRRDPGRTGRGPHLRHGPTVVPQWCLKFGQTYANELRRRRSRPGDKWHLDEVFLSLPEDQREAALPVAGCRSARTGAGYPRAKPAGQGSRPEVLAEAAQGLAVPSASDHHRQAGQLPGCPEGSPAGSGASAAPAAEQPSGKLPPANTPARADQAAVQVSRPGATVPLGLRADSRALSAAASSAHGCGIARRATAALRCLGGGHGAASDRLRRSSRPAEESFSYLFIVPQLRPPQRSARV